MFFSSPKRIDELPDLENMEKKEQSKINKNVSNLD